MITFDVLQARIKKAYQKEKNWRRVAQQFGINEGTAWDIAHGYEPKTPELRRKLGLPSLAPAPVCTRCGDVHVTKRCTAKPRHVTRWRDLPVEALRLAIELRGGYERME